MASIGVRSGLSFDLELNANLERELADDEEVRQNLKELAEIGVQYAQNLAARDTGKMADSIKFTGFEYDQDYGLVGVIEVGEDADYWVFIEYGTGARGAGSPQPEPGLPEGYEHGPGSGVTARPFMRPMILHLKGRIGD